MSRPELRCPITGELVEIVSCGDDHFLARTSLWTSRLFSSRHSLIYAVSHRNGRPPNFSENPVVVGEESKEKPEDAFADLRERERIVEDGANELADKIVHKHKRGGRS